MSKNLELDIDTMQDVYMSRDQRAAYQRIVNDARAYWRLRAALERGFEAMLLEQMALGEEDEGASVGLVFGMNQIRNALEAAHAPKD